jgi:predicted Fe-Mo cluster-binding NifX family protein
VKIAVSAISAGLDAEVDPRFGRCQYFIIIDPETMQFEAIENASSGASGGAGISAAQMIAGRGVQAVLTGNCGPNAYQVLSSAGIQVVTGVSGKVQDVIQNYKSGQFQTSSQPNVPDHFGTAASPGLATGPAFGRGRGMGMGRGMGRGMGMGQGMGRGMGMGAGMMPTSSTPQQQSPKQELETLKTQSQMLAQQLTEIQRRIEELEKR